MKDFQDTLTDAELDVLVDGEMTLTEQRALLARLENEPDGWRRLALAFLEAQALRQMCPGLFSDGPAWKSEKAVAAPLKIWSRASSIWQSAAIAVAAACVAFVWGMRVNQPVPNGAPRIADRASSPVAPETSEADHMRVMFPEVGGQWSEPVDLPVVDGSDARAQFWLSEQSVIPPSLRNALRETGRQVSESRHWMQVDLEDGRQGYVPVSELIVSASDPSQYP